MKIKNIELSTYVGFLDKLKLKGKASIGRTNLIKIIAKHLKVLGENQTIIIEEFDAWIDKEEGRYHNDNSELNEAMHELLIQDIEIEYNSPFKKDLAEALESYDEELSGQDALVYANLYENLLEEEK